MSQFTCLNCDARFATAAVQHEHYKTDWHRYNLKRRVAQLPPVTAEEFQQRVLSARSAQEAALEEQNISVYCQACRKQFSGQKAHDNHLNSKKHRESLARYEREQMTASGASSSTTTTTTTSASVCTRRVLEPRPHPALAAAAAGKGRLAFAERLANDNDNDNDHDNDDDEDDEDFEDIEGEEEVVEDEELDSDEWDKIPENPLTERDCLFCSHTSEDLVENLKHMSVAHSFFIPDTEYCTDIEGLLYYLGEKVANYFICLWCNDRGKTFYSLDAVRKHMLDKGHCQMLHEGVALAEYAEYYDYSSSYPDNKEGMDIDEEVVPELLDGDEYQLVLPSGAVIGHRSLLRYYKQNLRPERAVVLKKSDRKLHHVLSEYRALGWTQTQQQAAARKARDIHLMKRVQSKWQMKLGCKANKLQKHYRAQVLV